MSATDVSNKAAKTTNGTSHSRSAASADRVTGPLDDAVPPSGPRPSPRRLFAIAIVAAVLGLGITLSFGYAEHDPKPHEVRVAVTATPSVLAEVTAGLQRPNPVASIS